MAEFEPTAAQIKALDLLASDATHCALGGGARCVAGDTVLDGHVLTIAELAAVGRPVRVRTSHGYQIAEAPFRKGCAQLWEVVTVSGRRVEVTNDHRFWDGERWVKTCELGDWVGVQSSELYPQRCAYSYNDTPLLGGYVLEKVKRVTRTAIKNYYTLHVPGTEQYFANGILHHNSGKTFWLIYSVIMRACMAPGSRHAVFRFRGNAVNAAIVEDTFPKVMKMCFPEGFYDVTGWTKSPNLYYEFTNGSQVWFGGLDDKERVEKILGMEFVTLYFNECSQIPWQSVVTAKTRLAQKVMVLKSDNTTARELAPKCYYDFNPPSKRHWTYLQFVDKKQPENKQPVLDPFDYGFQFMNPESNIANLSTKFIDQLKALPAKARERFLMGKFADDSEGALWTDETIEQNRRIEAPQFVRIIVAVDPSGCSGDEDYRSDEIGITVIGLGVNGHGYLLEDLSGRYSPSQWGKVVNAAFQRHAADKVIAERNYGGAMVEAVLKAENPNLPVGLVTATRGKVVRAEPVSALYDAGKIHHCGYFPELEDQLCSFMMAGYQGMHSPDRADSLIWGVTELFPGIAALVEGEWRPPNIITRKRSASRYDQTN